MEAVLFLLLIVAGVALAVLFSGKRARELEEVAKRRGWTFHADHRPAEAPGSFWRRLFPVHRPLEPVFQRFDVFSRGGGRRAKHTMRGVLELPLPDAAASVNLMAGDYEYTTGSGKNQSTHNFSYLLIELPFAHVPGLVIRPQNVFDGIAAFFGFGDISFESEEFSRTFHVSGEDRRFAYDLCDPQMMQFLLMNQPPKFELIGRYLLVSDGSRTWSAAEFERHIEWACQFARQWPRHVVDRLLRETHALPIGAPGGNVRGGSDGPGVGVGGGGGGEGAEAAGGGWRASGVLPAGGWERSGGAGNG